MCQSQYMMCFHFVKAIQIIFALYLSQGQHFNDHRSQICLWVAWQDSTVWKVWKPVACFGFADTRKYCHQDLKRQKMQASLICLAKCIPQRLLQNVSILFAPWIFEHLWSCEARVTHMRVVCFPNVVGWCTICFSSSLRKIVTLSFLMGCKVTTDVVNNVAWCYDFMIFEICNVCLFQNPVKLCWLCRWTWT